MALHLLPQPKEVMIVKGLFMLDADTLILIPAGAGDETFFAARQLQDEVRAEAGLELPIVKAYAPPRDLNAILLVCGEEQAAAFGRDPNFPEIQSSLAGRALEAIERQAYTLTIRRGLIVLYASAPAGLFHATQTLRQVVRSQGRVLPTLTIRDWPCLPYRGLMLDISRRKVPTLVTLKHLVEELSHYKLNVLQLYTEHTFQFPRHPKIGDGCGSLSGQDILHLDSFCRQRHVELMPNLQSFGHARNILLIPEYQHLAETEMLWTLSPAVEGTHALLDELYADMLPSFTSNTFNVNCDETFDLGQGASKSLVDGAGVGRVYLDHILRLRELAARYGRRIQIWGDILLNHPELIGDLPDDVILLDWCYEPADEYPTTQIFGQAGRSFWVCPGVGSWNALVPRLDDARRNIRNFARDGCASGAEGMLNTDWGDYGHYQHLGLSWHGYLFGAAQAWTGGSTADEQFDDGFGALFFGPDYEVILQALRGLARTNDLPGVYHPNCSHTVLALFDDPLLGQTVDGDDALPSDTLRQMQSIGEYASTTCDALLPGHPQALTLREMASAARLTAYAARKTALSQAIRANLCRMAADPAPVEDAERRLYEQILSLRALAAELEELRAEWEALWLARARRSEIHVALGYFARLRSRFQAAAIWLEAQRRALLAGEPIDSELDTYRPGHQPILWQTWPD
jgi:hexosaminidase